MPGVMDAILDLLVNRPQAKAVREVEFPGGEMEQDIPLPMPPGGRMDPALMAAQPPDVLGAMGKAASGYRSLRDTLGGMERARDRVTNESRQKRRK